MSPAIVVLGDSMLDIDIHGSATRLCPDGPVPVIDEIETVNRPGGAALAAVLAARAGAAVTLITAIGQDEAGDQLRALLQQMGIAVLEMPMLGQTPVKKRVRVGAQSLLRLDTPAGIAESHVTAPALLERLDGELSNCGAVLVSDYGRGMAGSEFVRQALSRVIRSKPLVWDPHPLGAVPLPGARLVTPNAAEAAGALAASAPAAGATKARSGAANWAGRGTEAAALVTLWQAASVSITLGAHGALLSYGDGAPFVFPAEAAANPGDTCGGGDQYAASATVALAGGAVVHSAVGAAVIAAGKFVAAGGASALRFPDVPAAATPPQHARARDSGVTHSGPGLAAALDVADVTRSTGGVVVATGGCFDLLHAGHLATLRAARQLGDCLIVLVNSDASVRRLKGPGRPLVPAADRAGVLLALECVDQAVIFDEDTPVSVISHLRPDVWAKGGDYLGADMEETSILEQWGGQAVILPYLEGRSTTTLVQTAVAASEIDLRPEERKVQ